MSEKGVVKWYDKVKGYGFIAPTVGEKDIYVSKANIEVLEQELEKDDWVEYDVGQGAKGPEAKHVRRVVETE